MQRHPRKFPNTKPTARKSLPTKQSEMRLQTQTVLIAKKKEPNTLMRLNSTFINEHDAQYSTDGFALHGNIWSGGREQPGR